MHAGRETVDSNGDISDLVDCSQEYEIKAPLSSPTAFKTFGPKLPGLMTRKSSSFRNYILDTTVTSIAYFHCPLYILAKIF